MDILTTDEALFILAKSTQYFHQIDNFLHENMSKKPTYNRYKTKSIANQEKEKQKTLGKKSYI